MTSAIPRLRFCTRALALTAILSAACGGSGDAVVDSGPEGGNVDGSVVGDAQVDGGGGDGCRQGFVLLEGVGCEVILESLSVSEGMLTPAFDPAVDTYDVFVPTTVENLTLTATTAPGVLLSIHGLPIASGVPSGSIDLLTGETVVPITLTLGSRMRAVLVRVHRDGSYLKQVPFDMVGVQAKAGYGPLSADGNVVAIGAPQFKFDGMAANSGAVFIYRKASDGQWYPDGVLLDPAAKANDRFGSSVAVRGNTLVVGAPGKFAAGNWGGAVLVFEHDTIQWNYETTIVPLKSAAGQDAIFGGQFGQSVALDGTTIAVGAPRYPTPGDAANRSGAAYLYVKSGGAWSFQQRLRPSSTVGAQVGESVALHGDDLAVGAPGVRPDVIGKAYAYHRTGAVWDLERTLDASQGAQLEDGTAGFGSSVAVSNGYLAVGEPWRSRIEGRLDGIVYMYRRDAATSDVWNFFQKMLPSNPLNETEVLFGSAVFLRDKDLLIGAPSQNVSGLEEAGLVYRYELRATAWTPVETFRSFAPDAQDHFGAFVAATDDDVVATAPNEDAKGQNAFQNIFLSANYGAGYVFERP
ncbi:MAG: hypothetical protein KC416_08380 [Myxococcales bacterium]|nr:hypothetical protein [Myxococcales bacterium]